MTHDLPCLRLLSAAHGNCPASLAGCLCHLPGAYTMCGTRGVRTVLSHRPACRSVRWPPAL